MWLNWPRPAHPGACSPRGLLTPGPARPGACSPRGLLPPGPAPPGACSPRGLLTPGPAHPGTSSPRGPAHPGTSSPPGACSPRGLLAPGPAPPGVCSPGTSSCGCAQWRTLVTARLLDVRSSCCLGARMRGVARPGAWQGAIDFHSRPSCIRGVTGQVQSDRTRSHAVSVLCCGPLWHRIGSYRTKPWARRAAWGGRHPRHDTWECFAKRC
jgi:hypothetical protein